MMALGWATNESMIDAASAMKFLSSWAQQCKEDAGIPDLSFTGAEHEVDLENSLPCCSQLIQSRRSCAIRSAEMHAAAQWRPIIPMSPASGSMRLRMRTFRFSARAMEGLKSIANASHGITRNRRRGGISKLHAMPYSSLHSLGAHLWRSITRARNLSSASSTRCSFRAIDVTEDDDALPIRGTATAGTLAKQSLAFAAALLQEYNYDHHASAANLDGVGFFPPGRDDAATVTSIHENINMVYVTKCEMMSQDSDFGWGSAMAMRNSTSTSSKWEDGRVTLFGGEEDGTESIAAEIMLSREAMENMESDPAFMLSCS